MQKLLPENQNCPRGRYWRPLLGVLLLASLTGACLSLARAWDSTRLREAYIPDLQRMLRSNPQDAQLWALLGARLAEAQRYDEAITALEKAIARGDSDTLIWSTLAGCEAAAGHYRRVNGVLLAGIQKGILGLEPLRQQLPHVNVHSVGPDWGLAASHGHYFLAESLSRGSFLNGIVEWWGRHHPDASGFATRQEWIREEPLNPVVLRLWGEALAANGNYESAIVALRRSSSIEPRSPEPHLALAQVFKLHSQPAAAAHEYEECLRLRPEWPPAVQGLQHIGAVSTARFTDVTREAGIQYRWSIPGKPPYNILQTIGNGCAFLDYNRDGNLDILLVGPRLALYRGDGKGHFSDVTHEVGIDTLSGYFLGCAVGDYDNDGYDDVYISAYQGGILLHNEGGRRFRDVTTQAGIQPQPWGSSCAFVDVDNDGRLDLYVGNYVHFGPDTQPRLCSYGPLAGACGPDNYTAEHPVLYRNEGGGHFRDVSQQWHLGESSGKTLAVAFCDYDSSGRQSAADANDRVPGDLLQNMGNRFRNVAAAAGTAFDDQGHANSGMGADWGDYDNDGRPDLIVASYQGEIKCLYHNQGATFEEKAAAVGLDARALPNLSFGIKWLDYDNDGWLDLAIASGHVIGNVNAMNKRLHFRQPSQLLHNLNGATFVDVSSQAGEPFQRPIMGRGLAIGDFDNDGRVDMLIVDSDGSPILLHNETTGSGHWLTLRLRGVRSNGDGIGAAVTVEAGGLKQVRRCGTDGSYLSASDARVHFGLGPASSVDTLVIRWPSGAVTTQHHISVDRVLTVPES